MSSPSSPGAQPSLRSLWGRDLAAALAATASLALPASLVGTMAVQMRESLHFGATGLGLAVSAFYLGAAMFSVPGSRLAEAIGGARAMRVMLLAGAAVELGVAAGASSWATLTVLLFVAGALSGAMSPGNNLFLARRIARERQGLVFGLKQSAVPVASLLGGLAVPAIALSVGWRWAYVVGGCFALVSAAVIPASRVSLADRRRQRRQQARPEIRLLPLVVLGGAFGLGLVASSGCVAFLVSSAVHIGYAKGTAGVLAALAGVVAAAARITTGFQADRRGGRHLPVVATMLLVGGAGYAALAVAAAIGNRWLFAVAAVVALGSGWGWNGLLNYAVIRSHPHAPATSTGITQVGARLGGVLGPVVVGVAIAHGSYTDGWLVAVVAASCAAGAVLLGRRLLRRATVPAAEPAVAPPRGTDGTAGGQPGVVAQ